MSVEAIDAVWKYSKAKGTELLVLQALADYANAKDNHVSYPSLTKLAQKVRLDKRYLCKVLIALEASGELLRDRSTGGKQIRTRYTIKCVANSVSQDTGPVASRTHALNRNRTVRAKSSDSEKSKSHKETCICPLCLSGNPPFAS